MRFKPATCVALCAVLLALAACAQRAAPLEDLSSAPTGRFAFETRNTEWASFSERMRPVEPVTITGRLELPDTGEARVPVVVFIHSVAGIDRGHFQQYARALKDAGIGVFIMDSFGPRDIDGPGGHKSGFTLDTHTYDAFRALQILSTHPRIDPARIGIAGWSWGGGVADYTSREHYVQEYARHSGWEGRFAAHAAVYPVCGAQEKKIEQTGAPKLYMLAGNDDWTGVERCRHYIRRMRDAGYDVDVIVYEGAHHAFDYPGQYHMRRGVESWTECGWIRSREGFVDIRTGDFHEWGPDVRNWREWADGCTTTGVTLASDADARSRAIRDLAAFFDRTLND